MRESAWSLQTHEPGSLDRAPRLGGRDQGDARPVHFRGVSVQRIPGSVFLPRPIWVAEYVYEGAECKSMGRG
jgi:hypothetical protein